MSRVRGVVALVLVCGWGMAVGRAAIIDFYLYTEYSGGTPPNGPGPWLHAQLADVAGGVDLTLTSLLTGSTEFVSEWAFNLDPVLDPTHLSFALVSGGPAAAITTGTNSYTADGDGRFDILCSFATAPPSSRFNDSDTVTYKITSTDVITAASFGFPSEPDGGHGAYLTAAHVQGTGGGTVSGWVTVPEPASMGLLLGAALMLAACRRK